MTDTATEAKASKKAAAPVKGTAWLAEHVNEQCGTSYSSYQLRILLRKLVKEGVLDPREAGNYSFSGVRDPQVIAVVKAVKNGALEKEKKEGVAKAKKASADAAEEAAPKPRRPRAKKAAEPEPEPEVEDDEVEVEDDDDDMDLDEI